MIRLLQTLLVLAFLALPSFGAPFADPTPFPPESTPDPNIVQPNLVKRVAAVYPASAAAKQLRDEVFVAFEVEAQGRVHTPGRSSPTLPNWNSRRSTPFGSGSSLRRCSWAIPSPRG